jgi:hypothetical protein
VRSEECLSLPSPLDTARTLAPRRAPKRSTCFPHIPGISLQAVTVSDPRKAIRMEAPPSTPSLFGGEGTGSATMEIAMVRREADGDVSARDVGRQRARRVRPRADGAPPTKD